MRHVFFLVPLLLCSGAAWAGQIQGRITNPQGAAVAGAQVTVSTPQGDPRGKATSAADGSYAVPGLEPGSYTVTVSAVSPTATLRRQVHVAEGAEPVRADFQLPAATTVPAVAAEERNPNIFIYRIDLDDLRNRLQVARGPDPQYVAEFTADQNYYGAEFGAPILKFDPLRPRPLLKDWRGAAYGLIQNSVLNARNFFNVGPLRASRASNYDLTGSGPLPSRKATLLLDFGQSFSSGLVNGNVQAPRDTERTPASSDPRINSVIGAYLTAFPAELPNLPAVSLRQLYSNGPRTTKSTDALSRLDFKPSDTASYAMRYSVSDYSEDPFQLVAGQNPHTDVRTQSGAVSLSKVFSPVFNGQFGFYFDRLAAALTLPKQFANLLAPLGITTVPDVQFTTGISSSSELPNIGPGPQFPRRRIQNRFQFRADIGRSMGKHTLKAGWSIARVQVNDLQSDNTRGMVAFNADFGHTAVFNFLHGIPSSYTYAIGNSYRGFRNWEHALYVADEMHLWPTLSLSIGLRYELMTAPQEVNHLTDVGFPTDKNNLAPRFGFAWNPGKGKTVVRGSYGISYGTTFAASYGLTRFNEPGIQTITLHGDGQNLDLLSLLTGIRPTVNRSTRNLLSPDLVTPYSHQYTLGIERALPGATTISIAYIGMRSFHLFNQEVFNRAANVPGVIATTGNLDDRRPDPRYYAITVVDSSAIGYYDAAHLSVDKRISHGLSLRAAYTFGKSIDTGGDFTNNATNLETPGETGESQCEVCNHVSDHRAVSLFDTPHALTIAYSYNLPSPSRGSGRASAVVRGWQVSGTTILQSGTPFHLHTGSDGTGFGNLDGEAHDRPNVVDPSILGKTLDNPDTSPLILAINTCVGPNVADASGVAAPYERCKYFDTNLTPGGRGNIGMNTFRKDGTANFNFAVGRTFPLPGGRERSLQFRGEFINLFNHAQFDKPGVLISAATFGKIVNTVNKGRQVQFSLRLNF